MKERILKKKRENRLVQRHGHRQRLAGACAGKLKPRKKPGENPGFLFMENKEGLSFLKSGWGFKERKGPSPHIGEFQDP